MAEKKLDKNQLLAAESEKNTIVSAGAGSGKTTVLAQRFLRLIEKGLAGVENILTLTFTKKAAAEMYERIYKSLLINSEKENVKSAIKDFSKSSISTMDSFCSNIVRNNSNHFGVANDFSIDPAALEKLAEKTAYDFLFSNYNNTAVFKMINSWGFERILDGLLKKLALDHFNFGEDIDFLKSLDLQKKIVEKELDKILHDFVSSCREVENIEADFKALNDFRNSLYLINEILKNKNNSDWDLLVSNLESLDISKRTGNSKDNSVLIFKEIITEIKENQIPELKSLCLFMKNIPEFEKLFKVLNEFKDSFLDQKRKSGILGYKDLNLMALEILRNNPGLRNYYKRKYKYIMIDEFQDNNSLQRDLLYFLAEKDEISSKELPDISSLDKRKLFFVGDDKQSIYRFRGGDVSVFKGLCSEIAEIGGEAISLDTNYRSESTLIDFFNQIFPDIMSNNGEDFEADYEALNSRPADNKLKPRINVFLKTDNENPDSIHNDDAEAFYLAEFIKDAVENRKLKITKNGEYTYADYSDFAVLMRSTSNQIKYEKIFRRKGVPYSTQGVRALFMEAPVNDIYSFLQILIYPDDRISYAAFLRSPLVNISDNAMHRILVQGLPVFTEDLSCMNLSSDDLGKYNHAKNIYTDLKTKAENSEISELVSYIWFDLGYRYFLLHNPDYHIYLEYYDYLIKLADSFKAKAQGLVSFLDFIRNNLGKYEKIEDLEIEKESDAGVSIMTIHKSKGLQFPVVILANSGNKGRNDSSEPFYYFDDLGITVNLDKDKNCNYFYLRAKDLEVKKENAELKRLLYVAMTRAEHHLFISGVINKQNRSSDKTLMSLVFKSINFDQQNPDFDSNKLLIRIPEINEQEYYKGRVFSDIKSPLDILDLYKNTERVKNNFNRNDFTATELNSMYSYNKSGPVKRLTVLNSDKIIKKNNLESDFGTLCHYMIERKINKLEKTFIPDKYIKIFPEDSSMMIITEAEQLADNFIKSEFFSDINTSKAECEVSFILKEENDDTDFYIKGQIDFWLELDDKIIIIDFKTDIEIQADMYYPQLAVYKKAAEEISGKKAEVFLCYLREPEFVKFEQDINLKDILTGN